MYNGKVIALHAVRNGICHFPDLLWYWLGCFVVFTWMRSKSETSEIVVQI